MGVLKYKLLFNGILKRCYSQPSASLTPFLNMAYTRRETIVYLKLNKSGDILGDGRNLRNFLVYPCIF